MKNLTIGKRVALGFAIVLALTMALGALSYSRLFAIERQVAIIVGDCLPGAYLSGRIETEVSVAEIHVRQHLLSETAEQMTKLEQKIAADRDRVTQLYSDYEKTITQAEDRALFEKTSSFRPGYLSRRNAVLELSRAGKKREALVRTNEELEPYFDTYMEAVRALVAFNRKNAGLSSTAVAQVITASRLEMVMGVVLALGVGTGAGFFIVRDTNRNLKGVARAMEESSEQVAAAARQVAASSKMLADGASEQAASLEETSASLEEVASMTKHNAEGAQQAKELSGQARAAADSGATTMGAMEQAMDEIKGSSNDISKIIKTIDEIAFQTNILALNAAVEAARAGEAGMGFAVVAEEVRSLAQRSARSARETAEKIEVAIAKSEHGATLSHRVGESLAEIVDKARRVDGLVAEIATASGEQTRGIEQVHLAVNQMDKVTQSSAGSAEETAAAAMELDTQAARMRENVATLQKLVGGVAAQSTSAATNADAARPRRRASGRAEARFAHEQMVFRK